MICNPSHNVAASSQLLILMNNAVDIIKKMRAISDIHACLQADESLNQTDAELAEHGIDIMLGGEDCIFIRRNSDDCIVKSTILQEFLI